MPARRYWEDFEAGEVISLGTLRLSAAEIVDFARQWDPQPIHVDAEAAAAGPFGGLIASGWHTGSALMRRYVDQVLDGTDSRGSPGIEHLRWRRPVRPDVSYEASVTVLEATPSATRPDRGTLLLHWQLLDADGELVTEMTGRGLFGRRPAG